MANRLNINIGGEDRLACFGLQSVMELQEHYGGVIQLGEAFKKQDFSLFTAITYYTLKSGCNSQGIVPSFSLTDVYDWTFAKRNDKDLIDLVSGFSDTLSSYVNELKESLPKDEENKVVKKK